MLRKVYGVIAGEVTMNTKNILQRSILKAQTLLQGQLRCFDTILPYVEGKTGLEIGGPSAVFQGKTGILPLYPRIGLLDNCDISQSTVWAEHGEGFKFDPEKSPGRNIFCDGSDLSAVPDKSRDFVLSSHNLEHFANPVKALKEWQRTLKPTGSLILVLPNYRKTFDHRRTPTPVSHMHDDFERNTGEDDMTHLEEIMEESDLTMDAPAGTPEQFRKRSLSNYTNRCLHHHVFDEVNSRELLESVGMNVLAVEKAAPFHIFLFAQMNGKTDATRDRL
jgi:SAM-dependent methyltransferase